MSPESFKITVSRIRQFLQRDAKTIVRVESVNHFKQSFQDEGFTDETLIKWPDISEKRKEQKRRKNGNLPPILTDTGDLGRSITGEDVTDGVVISSDKVYAQRHNEGLNGMPKRQFMGPSKQLDKKILAKLDKGFGKLLNRF